MCAPQQRMSVQKSHYLCQSTVRKVYKQWGKNVA